MLLIAILKLEYMIHLCALHSKLCGLGRIHSVTANLELLFLFLLALNVEVFYLIISLAFFFFLQERKWPPPTAKRPPKGRGPGLTRDRSLDLQDRQRQEARRRLMAAKRAASFRQSSVSERADSIEIYIPEAQTRL